ncbi:MAG: histidine kinase [Actinomycetia bacterium]|nr:histidine kinase [Actinomycetes bacterium]
MTSATARPVPAAGAGPGRSWRERLTGPTLRTWLLYVPFAVLSSILAVSTWDSRRVDHVAVEMASNASMLVLLIGVLSAASLAWRRRYAVGIAVLTAVVALVLPLDPVAALIAFGSLAVRRLDRVVGAVAGLTGAATLVSTWRDSRGLSEHSSFWRMVLAPEGSEPLSVWAVIAISAALLAVAFGIAMLVRDQLRTRTHQEEGNAHREVVAGLNDELARQAERERLAQEVHDALGHRLSLLSLHAGAVQVRATDPALRESADLVRAGAEQAMTDLRSLLTMLRRPGGPDVADSVPGVHDLALLIDETSRTGITLVSTVQLESIEELDDLTSRSAFRIAQEMLTNARRHAPGIGVRFLVRATPQTGVIIESANHLPPETDPHVVAGSGLNGIRARVDQLGGDFRQWVDESRVFRVAVRLPWVARPDSGPAQWQPWRAGEESSR